MNRLIVAVALAATAGIAVAQSQPATVPPPADRRPAPPAPPAPPPRDPMGDKTVSRGDFLADAGARFDQMDADRNGQLTAEERRAWHERQQAWRGPGPRGPVGDPYAGPVAGAPGSAPGVAGGGPGNMLARLDADGDGQLTRAEYAAPFAMLDTDRSGVIEPGEMAPGGPGGARLARLDRDGDGKLTRAEFEAPFARLDRDGDGVVSAAEMAAIRARLGGRFGGRGPRAGEAELAPQ